MDETDVQWMKMVVYNFWTDETVILCLLYDKYGS